MSYLNNKMNNVYVNCNIEHNIIYHLNSGNITFYFFLLSGICINNSAHTCPFQFVLRLAKNTLFSIRKRYSVEYNYVLGKMMSPYS